MSQGTLRAAEKNPLHVACYEGQLEVAKQLLLKGGMSVKKLLNSQDKSGWTPLHCCSAQSHLELCKLLIQAGADVTIQNSDGGTALHYLARVLTDNEKLYLEVLQMFLKKGGNVNSENRTRETALHRAAQKSNTVALEFLLANGADVNAATEFGETALITAVRRGVLEPIKVLLDHGADAHLVGEQGSALALAESIDNTEILELIKNSNSYKTFIKRYGHPARNIGAAFGIQRGRCSQAGCDCHQYHGGAACACGATQAHLCQNCGHLPAQHKALSTIPEDDKGAPQLKQGKAKELTLRTALVSSSLAHSWEIHAKELRREKLLGEGAAALVYKGKFRGQDVAIKVLKQSLDPKLMADFEKEFHIYANFRSPHVVLFFGACLQPDLCMVLEFCQRGSLWDLLNSNMKLDFVQVLKFSVDTARSLAALHCWSPPIVHRDVKSLILLVDSHWTVKVSDFGLSRYTEKMEEAESDSKINETLGKLCGTYAYTAPELFFKEPYTVKSDIYSVGMIFWEMAKRSGPDQQYMLPFSEYPELVFDFQILIQVAHHKKRPTIPDHVNPQYRDLINRCWSQKPDERPDIAGVLASLAEITKTIAPELGNVELSKMTVL